MRKYFYLSVVTFFLMVVQLGLLRYLPYSTSFVSWIDVQANESMQTPHPDFSVGTIRWDMKAYEKSQKLSKLREYFRERCGERKGVEAASCVSLELIEMIPKGTPKREIFDADYSPSKAFQKHLEGEEGFCTNYAGMSSAMLLSVGIPARFIQIRPNDGHGGHNIIEVWDDRFGWVLFDPFNNGVISHNGKPVSALQAHFADQVERVDAETPGLIRGHLPHYFENGNRFRSTLVYPEPWLYTRVGTKEVPFFRGAFVGLGNGFFKFSLAQNLLRVGILLCGVFLFVIGLISATKWALAGRLR